MTTVETPLSYYICKSIHEASASVAGFSALYEERLTLIRASSRVEASKRAEQLVGSAVHSYRNVDGDTITWTCKRIVHVVEVVDAALDDGAQIYVRHFTDLDLYERFEREGLQTATVPYPP